MVLLRAKHLRSAVHFILVFQLIWAPFWPPTSAGASGVEAADPFSPLKVLVDHTGADLSLKPEYSDVELNRLLDDFSRGLAGESEQPIIFDKFHLLAQSAHVAVKQVMTNDDPQKSSVRRVYRAIDVRRLRVQLYLAETSSQPFNEEVQLVDGVGWQELAKIPMICPGECYFRFVLASGEVLNDFRIPVQWMARLGPFIVMQTKWYEDRLSVINLSEFRQNIGNADLPIFDVPFPFLTQLENDLPSIKGQTLRFDSNYVVSESQLRDISRVYEGMYFMTANLLDPARMLELSHMGQMLLNYIGGSTFNGVTRESQSEVDIDGIQADIRAVIGRQLEGLKNEMGQQESNYNGLATDRKQGADGNQYFEGLRRQQIVERSLRDSLETYAKGQRVSGKLKALLATIMAPNAMAADLIEGSMIAIFAKLRQSHTGETPASVLYWLTRHPLTSISGITLAGMTLVAPDSVAVSMREAFAALDFVFAPVLDMIKGTSLAVWQSTVDISAIFIDTKDTIAKQYIQDGNWWRLSVGLTALAGALIVVIGGYHSLASHFRLFRDFQQGRAQSLVERQEAMFADYYDLLARAEEMRRQHDKDVGLRSPLTASEVEVLNLKIEQVETREREDAASRSQAWHGRLGRTLLGPVVLVKMAARQAGIFLSRYQYFATNLYPTHQHVRNQWQALSSIVFSYASYTRSVLDLVAFWNGFSRFRYSLVSWGFLEVFSVRVPAYIRLHPQVLFYQLSYPNFFRESVVKGGGDAIPSIMNGGMTSVGEVIMRWLGRYSGLQSMEDIRSYHKAYEEFENHSIEIEKVAVPKLTWAAIEMLGTSMRSDRDLQLLLASDGIQRISDEVVDRLSNKSQRFVRVYYELLYNRVMARLLQEKVRSLPANDLQSSLDMFSHTRGVFVSQGGHKAGEQVLEIDEAELDRLSLYDYKEILARHATAARKSIDLQVAENQLDRWITEETQSGEILQETLQVLDRDRALVSQLQRKYKTLAVLDPKQNGSFKRYAVVQEKSKDPVALARAIKAEIGQMLVTLPIDIGVKLLASAGIYEGLYKPIQETMLGPNSVFYLSQMSFYNGVVFGVFIGIFSKSWYKIQENAFHDDNGEMGIVPRGEDAKKSYFRWFMKMTFGKTNSFLLNYKRMANLMFWNLPAAMVFYGTFQPFFLGRIDIEAVLAGYAVGFMTPVFAFRMKLEQGFERSAYYDARHFTERELSSAQVQKFMESRIQRRRNKFNLLSDLFMNWVENWGTNIFFVPQEGLGPRAFFRSLFNGWLPTEILIDRLHFVNYQVADVPILNNVVSTITSKCEMIFSRGNPDLIKIK